MYACINIYWSVSDLVKFSWLAVKWCFILEFHKRLQHRSLTLHYIICLSCLNPDADGFKLWEPFVSTWGQKGVVHWNGRDKTSTSYEFGMRLYWKKGKSSVPTWERTTDRVNLTPTVHLHAFTLPPRRQYIHITTVMLLPKWPAGNSGHFSFLNIQALDCKVASQVYTWKHYTHTRAWRKLWKSMGTIMDTNDASAVCIGHTSRTGVGHKGTNWNIYIYNKLGCFQTDLCMLAIFFML